LLQPEPPALKSHENRTARSETYVRDSIVYREKHIARWRNPKRPKCSKKPLVVVDRATTAISLIGLGIVTWVVVLD
jgi:hypothetical protein